jgi:cytosol alanyl aminopeptidase
MMSHRKSHRPALLFLLAGCAGVPSRAATHPPAVDSPADGEAPALRLDGSVVPREYQLDLTLDPDRPDFRGRVTIPVQVQRPIRTIWLHGKNLQITKATVTAGKETPAAVRLAGELVALTLPEAIGAGSAQIQMEYVGQLPTTEQEGLFRQSEDGRTYVFSQFEATGARLAFPCFDEPSYKVPWQVTVHVPDGLVALSNTLPDRESIAGGVRTVAFARTRPLPSYLVALAVGPFDLVDLGRAGRNRIPLRIAVPKGRAAEARYARQVTGQLLDAVERYFDIPYPYEKLDSVAMLSFPGAMENAGLITYGAKLLLAKPSEETPAFKMLYASVAAHEIAHHWFGDLVTMAWWDDIWLNESFATFVADRVVDDWQKSWGVAVSRVERAQEAFKADSLMTARKVHNPIRQHNDILGAFDSISYAKGGSLLDMFEGWMGRGGFQKAIHRYLRRHAFGNATSQDFIDALAAESRPEVAAAFAGFIDQGGIPLVNVALECPAGQPPQLALSQERFLPVGSRGSAAQTWSIPMCVGLPGAAGGDPGRQCFLFSGQQARVPLESPGCPAWIDANAGGGGYYRVAYQGDLGRKLLERGTLDAAGRVSALFNLAAMVEAGRVPMSELLAVVPAVARNKEPEILGVAIDLSTRIEPFVSEAGRARYQRFLADSFSPPARALGWKARPGESVQASKLRPRLLGLAALQADDATLVAGARALAERFLRRPETLDPQLAPVVLAAAAEADPGLFEQLETALARSTDRNVRSALLAGLVMSRGPGQRERTLARLAGGGLTIEEMVPMITLAMGDPATRGPLYDYVARNYERVTAPLSPLIRPGLAEIAAVFCDKAHREHANTVLRDKVKDMPGGKKTIDEVVERIDLCIAHRARFGREVDAFLEKR